MTESFPERLPRQIIEQRQLVRLNAMLEELKIRNPFWRERLNRVRGPLQSIQQISELPFLSKNDLVQDQLTHPPYGSNLTYPLTQYSRLHQTSGTTGKPLRLLDTPDSWSWMLDLWGQIYRLVGIREDDVFAFPFSFGPFIGFWAAFEGAQRSGNLSLAMGGMSSEARLKMIDELHATIVCCTPTYALRLIDVAAQMGISLKENPVRMLILAGEPGAAIPSIREKIQSSWNARVIDHWGMTDIGSLGTESERSPGELIVLETECVAEIIEQNGTEPVSPGEIGELVITNLGRWGQPVIRYRTGDLVRAVTTPSNEGIELLRLQNGILGRADDMVTIRGNNVFPTSVDALLRQFEEIVEYRITVVTRRSMPHMVIEIEPAISQKPSQTGAELLSRVGRAIKDRLNFQAEIQIAENLPRFEMKGRRFFREERSERE